MAVSDATGELAHNLAVASARQFQGVDAKIIRRGRVTHKNIPNVIEEARLKHAVILFTMVSHDFRRELLSEAKKAGVIAMDVMGPVLDMLSNYFHTLPSDEPGLQYKISRDYYKRTEAVEFSVRHDDGLEIETIDQADIVLLGISRTSKTPLSIYLAYHGYRCANIPLMIGIEVPEKLKEVDKKKLVGLLILPQELSAMRSTRLKKMGRPDSEPYAQKDHIEKEIGHAREVFEKLGVKIVVDVTGKATEEVASEILHALSM